MDAVLGRDKGVVAVRAAEAPGRDEVEDGAWVAADVPSALGAIVFVPGAGRLFPISKADHVLK